jgi:hypothetical protein
LCRCRHYQLWPTAFCRCRHYQWWPTAFCRCFFFVTNWILPLPFAGGSNAGHAAVTFGRPCEQLQPRQLLPRRHAVGMFYVRLQNRMPMSSFILVWGFSTLKTESPYSKTFLAFLFVCQTSSQNPQPRI